jgi:hypothetical protein
MKYEVGKIYRMRYSPLKHIIFAPYDDGNAMRMFDDYNEMKEVFNSDPYTIPTMSSYYYGMNKNMINKLNTIRGWDLFLEEFLSKNIELIEIVNKQTIPKSIITKILK